MTNKLTIFAKQLHSYGREIDKRSTAQRRTDDSGMQTGKVRSTFLSTILICPILKRLSVSTIILQIQIGRYIGILMESLWYDG